MGICLCFDLSRVFVILTSPNDNMTIYFKNVGYIRNMFAKYLYLTVIAKGMRASVWNSSIFHIV